MDVKVDFVIGEKDWNGIYDMKLNKDRALVILADLSNALLRTGNDKLIMALEMAMKALQESED